MLPPDVSLGPHHLSSSVLSSPSLLCFSILFWLSFIRTLVIGFEAYPDLQGDLLHLQRIFLTRNFRFQRLEPEAPEVP